MKSYKNSFFKLTYQVRPFDLLKNEVSFLGLLKQNRQDYFIEISKKTQMNLLRHVKTHLISWVLLKGCPRPTAHLTARRPAAHFTVRGPMAHLMAHGPAARLIIYIFSLHHFYIYFKMADTQRERLVTIKITLRPANG